MTTYSSNKPIGLLIVNLPLDYTVQSREDLKKHLEFQFPYVEVLVCNADVQGVQAQYIGVNP